MITKLKISDFKAHRNTELSFAPLTLLTGINSSGKSTILQALLLLRQSLKKNRLEKGLDLNAPLCDIGKVKDALYRASKSEIISFTIKTDETFTFSFNAKGKYEDTFIPADKPIILSDNWREFPLFTNDFQYLSSSRWANLNQYPIDTYAVETERQLSLEYGQGELVGHFLSYYGENRNFDIVSDLLLHPTTNSTKLLAQTIAWEQEISPRITIRPIQKDDKVSIEYGYRSEGISYSLSIVVALLSAKPGALILIENPEAHLHPRGQSKLAELIALVAQSGVQVVVETHSDHLFNGILKAVAQDKIKREKVKVHFLELDNANVSIHTEIDFSEKGRILNPKKGFFDQFDDDLDVLLGL